MKTFSLFDNLCAFDGLETRVSLTSLLGASSVAVVTAADEDPLPDPEPSPGPYPGEDAPLEYPDPPPSGPVGPGSLS